MTIPANSCKFPENTVFAGHSAKHYDIAGCGNEPRRKAPALHAGCRGSKPLIAQLNDEENGTWTAVPGLHRTEQPDNDTGGRWSNEVGIPKPNRVSQHRPLGEDGNGRVSDGEKLTDLRAVPDRVDA